MAASITHEVYRPQRPDRVGTGLTDSAEIGKWLMPREFEPRPVAPMR